MSPLNLHDKKKLQQQKIRNLTEMLDDLEEQIHFQSLHKLKTNFVVFNQGRDLFITCGEDGSIFSYSSTFTQPNRYNTRKLGYLSVFKNEPIISVSWATQEIGCYIAVGSSKWSIAIIFINERTGYLKLEKIIKIPYSICSIDWHPCQKKVIVGGKGKDGHLLIIQKKEESWISSLKINLKIQQTQILAAYAALETSIILIACGTNILFLKNEISQHAPYPLVQSQDIVLSFLCSKVQRAGYLEMIVLTAFKITIYRLNIQKYKQKQSLPVEMVTVISLNKEYDKVQWGWNQNYICLYEKNLYQSQDKLNLTTSYTPTIYKRKVNGFWKDLSYE